MLYFVEILWGYQYKGLVEYIPNDDVQGIKQTIFNLANFIGERYYWNEEFRDILHAYIIVELNIINKDKVKDKYKELIPSINDIIAQYSYVLDM